MRAAAREGLEKMRQRDAPMADLVLAGHYGARYGMFGRIAEAMQFLWSDVARTRETS